MNTQQFNRHLVCPWCHKGEIIADTKSKAQVSAQCPKCKKFFIGDLDNLKTERSVACRKQVHRA